MVLRTSTHEICRMVVADDIAVCLGDSGDDWPRLRLVRSGLTVRVQQVGAVWGLVGGWCRVC